MNLEIRNLSHIYMPETAFCKKALNNINLKVNKGEFVGLIGHSGSGKSTLIQHINGLIPSEDGTILLDGRDINSSKEYLREIRFKVGLVFQYPEAQLFEETVYDDIAFGPRNMGLSEEEVKNRVEEACELCGISEDKLNKSPFDLSGGQKRRVAIAGVVSMNPEILILDEPTAGLDPKSRNSILGRIKELHKKTGMSVILVSHSMEDIANNVERIVVLSRGEIIMDGTREEVFKQSERLVKIGLGVPTITQVFMRLREKGFKLPDNVFTVPYAKDVIKEIVTRRDNNAF